ncbi:MAG: PadR family transcriptional regulator [Thermoanaerobaculia bacterium]|nr:PadR family transcriptional regulator [Thermoanaerobaculia bacterium]
MTRSEHDFDTRSALPLRPLLFEILLLLHQQERHGYALMRDLAESSDGRFSLGPGTLYRTLKDLRDRGWIEQSEARPAPELDDERRRYYRLTELGRQVASAEAARLESLVREARTGKLLPWRKSG